MLNSHTLSFSPDYQLTPTLIFSDSFPVYILMEFPWIDDLISSKPRLIHKLFPSRSRSFSRIQSNANEHLKAALTHPHNAPFWAISLNIQLGFNYPNPAAANPNIQMDRHEEIIITGKS